MVNRRGDRVFFLYSGHGTRVKDERNGDEEDGEDEALAPYDVDRFGNTIIRDDVFNQLLGELSGRTVVMVFDSCHSGTISRGGIGGTGSKSNARANASPKYLPSPEEFAQFAKEGGARTRSGANSMVDYVVEPLNQQDVKSRDLNLVVDRKQIKNASVVIFSAAHSRQRAFPLEVSPRRFRGALSYAFNQAQEKSAPTLQQLKKLIEQQIAKWQSEKRLFPEQQPTFEVIAGGNADAIESQPLFGLAANQPAQAPPSFAGGNNASDIRIALEVMPNRHAFRLGETFHYRINATAAGYLYLLVFRSVCN